ncbi:hypothetical protein PCE1_004661 [Barthelona sp. PCE]
MFANDVVIRSDVITDDDLKKDVIVEGLADIVPPKGADVYVHYHGTLLDGTVFDSSYERSQPFNFKLGERAVISGWDLGVATMKLGEICHLICPPQHAYGDRDSGKIPANSTLHFRVELLGFRPAGLFNAEDVEESAKMVSEYKNYGNLFIKAKRFDGAVENYVNCRTLTSEVLKNELTDEQKEAVKLADRGAALNLAFVNLKAGHFGDVKRYCTAVLNEDPENIKAIFRLGLAYRGMGEFDEAVAEFERILTIDPNQVRTANELKTTRKMANRANQKSKKASRAAFRAMAEDLEREAEAKKEVEAAKEEETAEEEEDLVEKAMREGVEEAIEESA